ncbi:MAG: copper chaperone PCu(A)C [Woeseiaceae bacterium]
MRVLTLSLLLIASCLAPACQKTSAPLTVENAWIRLSPPGAAATAGYLTINNRASDALLINRVRSEAYGNIEIHESSMTDGKMTMRPVETLLVAPNDSISLKPGGLHLMLFNPSRTLTDGESVELTLFDGERPVAEITAIVARENPHD